MRRRSLEILPKNGCSSPKRSLPYGYLVLAPERRPREGLMGQTLGNGAADVFQTREHGACGGGPRKSSAIPKSTPSRGFSPAWLAGAFRVAEPGARRRGLITGVHTYAYDRAPGATDAFSGRPLSHASRPFTGRSLKTAQGRKPKFK